jgi:hypothetical protein
MESNSWRISTLVSKAEILVMNLHLARFIHGKVWRSELESYFCGHVGTITIHDGKGGKDRVVPLPMPAADGA